MPDRSAKSTPDADARPYWLLVAILASTLPLSQALAVRLHRAALELHVANGGVARLHGDLATGEVRRLGRDLALGSIAGPGFEAHLDTPSGSGRVRFILTRQGLEAAGISDAPDARPH